MDSKEVIDSLNLITDIYFKDGTVFLGYGHGFDQEYISLFQAGHVLFLAGGGAIENMTEMDDDFGFVPFPRGDNAKDYRGFVNWNYPAMLVPAGLSADDQKAAGQFIQAFAYESSTNTIKSLWQEFSDRHVNDDRSAEMMKLLSNKAVVTPASIYSAASGNDAVMDGTYRVMYGIIGQERDTSYIQSSKSSTIAALNDMIAQISK